MARFTAPWDGALAASTALSVLLLAGLLLWLPGVGLLAGGPAEGPAVLRLVPLVLLAVLGVCWGLAPRGFAIEGEALLLLRRLGPVRIPLSRITGAGLLPSLPRPGTLRIAGTSGLFGYFGRYWSPGLGRFRLHATRRAGLVLVDTADGRWVLSPDAPEAFLAALRRSAPGASAEPRPAAGVTGGAGPRAAVAMIVALAGLLVAGIVAAVLGFAPVAARVDGEAVVVERRWFGAVAIPLAEVRQAELLAPALRRGWIRTAGTSLPGGVAYGSFSSRDLGDFRLYAWRPGPLVRLDTTGGPVVLSPDEPEAFVAEVRARLPAAPP